MNRSFITVTPDTGQNNGTLSISADKNEDYTSRITMFNVEGGGITKSVNIRQKAYSCIYIDCGYIFYDVNMQEPYKLIHNGPITMLMFDVKFTNFILSSKNIFAIKNVSTLPIEFNNPVISFMNFASTDQSLGIITLDEFTTKLIPTEGTVLAAIDITPTKINEIVTKINSVHDAIGNMRIIIYIKTTGTKEDFLIQINVI